jgi:hypothetical protein
MRSTSLLHGEVGEAEAAVGSAHFSRHMALLEAAGHQRFWLLLAHLLQQGVLTAIVATMK